MTKEAKRQKDKETNRQKDKNTKRQKGKKRDKKTKDVRTVLHSCNVYTWGGASLMLYPAFCP